MLRKRGLGKRVERKLDLLYFPTKPRPFFVSCLVMHFTAAGLVCFDAKKSHTVANEFSVVDLRWVHVPCTLDDPCGMIESSPPRYGQRSLSPFNPAFTLRRMLESYLPELSSRSPSG